jgi:hypothetical protein
MYSLSLYCSDPACDAVFEAEGSFEALGAAICPFCGCTLGELDCAPVDCGPEEASTGEELELWIVHGPVGRRLRRRRRRRREQLREAA